MWVVDLVHYGTNQYLFYFHLNCVNVMCVWTELESDCCSKMSQVVLIQLHDTTPIHRRLSDNWIKICGCVCVSVCFLSLSSVLVCLYAPHTIVMDWAGLNFCCMLWIRISPNGVVSNFWAFFDALWKAGSKVIANNIGREWNRKFSNCCWTAVKMSHI